MLNFGENGMLNFGKNGMLTLGYAHFSILLKSLSNNFQIA